MPTSPAIGDPAPPLDLPTTAGDRWALADQRGRTVLVTFLRHAG